MKLWYGLKCNIWISQAIDPNYEKKKSSTLTAKCIRCSAWRGSDKEVEKKCFVSFHCQEVLLPSSNLCGCSCTLCQHVQKARMVWAFFLFSPPNFSSSLLASGTGSETLIWLPVRQQPFNNNAIVPHSSSPVSLIRPAVCRWYIVCDLRKHSPFRDVFPFLPDTFAVPFCQ